jgi:hypothetical protein
MDGEAEVAIAQLSYDIQALQQCRLKNCHTGDRSKIHHSKNLHKRS